MKIYPENIQHFSNPFRTPPPGFPSHVSPQGHSSQDLKNNNQDECVVKLSILEKEMVALKSEKSKSDKENDSYRNTIHVLEEKLANAEKVFYEHSSKSKKSATDKLEEIKVLKAVIKNNNDEIAHNKVETKDFNKVFKSKEKEIHNLDTKALNQEQTIASLKESNNKLKKEIKKLNRFLKLKKLKCKILLPLMPHHHHKSICVIFVLYLCILKKNMQTLL